MDRGRTEAAEPRDGDRRDRRGHPRTPRPVCRPGCGGRGDPSGRPARTGGGRRPARAPRGRPSRHELRDALLLRRDRRTALFGRA